MIQSAKQKIAGKTAEQNAALILADGAVFFGHGVGSKGTTFGEICFNTAMTGYQEILTDPSYSGQIITFTFPHIGNVGTNEEDVESRRVFAKGLILRDNITDPSNFRSTVHFNEWLKKNKVTGICGIDTRAITRKTRLKGAQNVAIVHANSVEEIDIDKVKKELADCPSMKGLELAEAASCDKPYEWTEGLWRLQSSPLLTSPRLQGEECSSPPQAGGIEGGNSHPRIVAIDYGAKHNILRNLAEAGCKVTVVPAKTSAKDIFAYDPDGIFLSNGPGDPAATGKYALPVIKELLESGLPIFGICLGHQLLGLALGCKTKKMHQGHRGANHPVKELATGRVMITSQNHGFVVSEKNLPKNIEVTHISLFDKTVQGIKVKNKTIFSVQGHPEASPGPHDTRYLFKRFVDFMNRKNLSSHRGETKREAKNENRPHPSPPPNGEGIKAEKKHV